VLAGAAPVFADDETPTPTPTATDTPTEEPTTPAPKFDAVITPNPFHDGDRLTLTTTGCPTVPTVNDVDGLFTGPLVLHEVADLKHRGSAKTKSVLPRNKVFHLIVTCKDVAKITFTTKPGSPTTKKPGGQTGVTPVGGVQTGDGSSLRDSGTPVLPIAAGGAVVLAAGLGLAYRRRKAQEDA
jgi:hypothetical protein